MSAERITELDGLINDWLNDRTENYPNFGEQFDKLWHDIDSGKLDKTGAFYLALKKEKDDNPKPDNLDALKEELEDLLTEGD